MFEMEQFSKMLPEMVQLLFTPKMEKISLPQNWILLGIGCGLKQQEEWVMMLEQVLISTPLEMPT